MKHLYSHAKYGTHNYDHRTDCDWAIEAPPGKNVHLTFVTFLLESEAECNYDFVEVYSGLDTSGLLHGRYCGSSVSTDFHLPDFREQFVRIIISIIVKRNSENFVKEC